MIRTLAIVGLMGAAGSCAAVQTTYYVDGACGDDAWSGLSQDCGGLDGPKKTIRSAVNAAVAGDTVEVAPGTYPMTTNYFSLNAPITVRAREGPAATVLDGEGDGDDRVMGVAFQGDGVGVINGFTITRIDAWWQHAPIAIDYGDLTLINCRFIGNTAWSCGAVYLSHGGTNTVTAINCVFQGNHGGGVAGSLGSWTLEIVGCTFVDNTNLGEIGDVLGYSGVSISNSIFRGQSKLIGGDGPVTYCNVQGGHPGEGNIDADPLFVNADAGDLRLSTGSPCIDAGSNSAVPEWVLADIDGLPRFVDDPGTVDTGEGSPPVVDMGAHEFQAMCYADFTGDGALDLFDFLAYVNAFNEADMGADCTKDGVLDLFDFLCFVNGFNEGC